jgi:hypothetical protein
MHFPCWQAHRSLKTGSLCLVQSPSASNCRGSVSRKNSVLDQREFGWVDQEEAAFSLRKANVEATRLLRLSGGSLIIRRPEEWLADRRLRTCRNRLWMGERLGNGAIITVRWYYHANSRRAIDSDGSEKRGPRSCEKKLYGRAESETVWRKTLRTVRSLSVRRWTLACAQGE